MVSARTKRQLLAAVMATVSGLWIGHAALAQSGETYKVWLTPVPLDSGMVSTVAGKGVLTGVLAGKKLTISGTFAGLKSPATDAHIHHGPKAVRGPVVLDFPIPKATSGTINASIDLTPEQVEALKTNSLYIQINSQGAPNGNLWGWLLH